MSFDIAYLGRSGKFGELLEFLQSADYSDGFICRRFNLRRAEDFNIDRKRRAPLPTPQSEADILTSLFLAGESIARDSVEHLLGIANIELLKNMGLLRYESASAQFYATVALYPVGDLFIASDRWDNYDGSQFSVPEDIVYPAFIPNTRLFLAHMPEEPRGKYLDLCGGTGIGALLAARSGAEQAWTGDISDRSTCFAEFNRQLNGISNVKAITSDLYQNFKDCRFDLITAHPPYVPTLQPKWIFFSGGQDGEDITRRIIEGLPDYLNDSGKLIVLTMGTDRVDRPFEQRIREWLGNSEKEFDIAFLVRKELEPQEFALRANRDTIRSIEESERWTQLFKSLNVTSLVYGFICIQRRATAHRTFTVRRQAVLSDDRAPWEWLLKWESTLCSEGLAQLILDTPLQAAKQIDFEILHHLEQGLWNPASYKLRIEHPFSMECNAQPWMAHLISLCDGKTTGREALQTLIRNEALPKATPAGEFARATASLISGGFVEIEGFRPPQAAE
jgi:methylase of polypeptide subunit release factors